MNIKDLKESRSVSMLVVCLEVLPAWLSYWVAYACTYGFSATYPLSQSLKVELLIAALAVLPAMHFVPPVFMKRSVRGNVILSKAARTVFLQALFFLAGVGLLGQSVPSWTVPVVGAGLLFLFLCTERNLVHRYLKRMRSEGFHPRHVVLVGHPWILNDVYHTLRDSSLGYKVQGIFTRQQLPADMTIENLGDRRVVLDYLRRHVEVSDLYIVPDSDYVEETEAIFRYCEDHMIRFYALPVFMDFLTKRMELSHLGNTMLLSVRDEPLQKPMNQLMKRAFDIAVSGTFLLTVFPIIYVVVAIFIKSQSPGPVFFKQKRNGLDGNEFECLKFRSMHVNKDADRLQATKDDPRKFKFGDLMRRTNIDELPQFINVLKGDMSVVGPRPHMLLHTQEYSHLIRCYMVRHLVKPGITGWAQAQGLRGETKTLQQMENRVKADIWYVENWSFSLDLSIIWQTAANMIKHNEKNAY